jgi:hypothetical protein
LNKEYEGKEEDKYYLHMQASLGTEAERKSAYDKDGKFHCIKWYNCSYCPAFNSKYCA